MTNFQLINDPYYKKIPTELKKHCPQFVSVFDAEEIIPMLSEFANTHVIPNITNEQHTQKCFAFINHAIQHGGHKTKEAIYDSILEKFYDPNLLQYPIKYLNKSEHEFLIKTSKNTHTAHHVINRIQKKL